MISKATRTTMHTSRICRKSRSLTNVQTRNVSACCCWHNRENIYFTKPINNKLDYGYGKPRFIHTTKLFSSLAGQEKSSNQENVNKNILNEVVSQVDFFGEPVTFLGTDPRFSSKIDDAMASLDVCLVAIATKGKSCSGGGDDEGIPARAAHSFAMAWSDFLQHATLWNHGKNKKLAAPMLAVAAIAPLLAQTGVDYIKYVDTLLSHVETPKQRVVQMIPTLEAAILLKDDPDLSSRERLHLQALDSMLHHQHRQALKTLLKVLQQCPGDALALSLALELSNTVGSKKSALWAAGSVAAYWQERGSSVLRQGIPGYNIGTSWISLGYAIGGRLSAAERLAERAMKFDLEGCSGIATWALAHVYDSEGRTAEGISALSNNDGVARYESCGQVFFDSYLGGYGARFSLEREGVHAGKTALRIYDNNYDRVFQYSGFAQGQRWKTPSKRIPSKLTEHAKEGVKSIFSGFFSGKSSEKIELAEQSDSENDIFTVEDVLTWLPPTPQMLTNASLILLTITLNGTISASDERWANLRAAWKSLKEELCEHKSGPLPLDFYPLATIASSLVSYDEVSRQDTVSSHLSAGLGMMGELMQLGVVSTDKTESKQSTVDNNTKEKWIRVVDLLATSLSTEVNSASFDFEGWEIDMRPIEHAICHAACMSEDYDSLCIARSICSRGVSFRPNSPEEWWRYSLVLEQLGDEIAAEDARAASLSLGSGQGEQPDR